MAFAGAVWESVVYLSLSGSPVTGVLFSAVTAQVKKMGGVLVSRTVATGDWVELGFGYYVFKWAVTDMDTLGPFFFRLTGVSFDPVVGQFDVSPAPISSFVPANTCIVTGNIRDLGGNPAIMNDIIIRGENFPTVSGTSLITADLLRSRPDAMGNFSIPLLRKQQVIFEVDRTGIRNQITVPDLPTAAILDLLPPIV